MLAPGATLTLPRAWTPRPGRLRPGYPRWVDAADVSAGIDGIVTRFPVAAGGEGTTLLVRLDLRGGTAVTDDVRVDVGGGTLGERRVFEHGSRVDLLYRVDTTGAMLVVTVRTGPGWRLAGVLAGRDVDAAWVEALAAGTACRILPGTGDGVGPGATVVARSSAAAVGAYAPSASRPPDVSSVGSEITLTALDPGAIDEQ